MRHFDIHGVPITVECSDSALEQAIRSRLNQFETPTAGGAAVRFFYEFAPDTASHSITRPDSPGRAVYDPPAGEVLFFPHSDTLFIDYERRVLVLCDARAAEVRISVIELDRSELWLLSRPLFTLPLMELLKRRGLHNVHAAGVAANRRAVLFAGGTGAGKSTLTVAHASRGFSLLGDDLVFLRSNSAGVEVLAFPDEIDITPETAALFPALERFVDRPVPEGWPKHRIRPESLFVHFDLVATPAALIFPSVQPGSKSFLEPFAPGDALKELAPNVLLTEPASSQAHLDALATLARQSDCYRLVFGRDVKGAQKLIRELL